MSSSTTWACFLPGHPRGAAGGAAVGTRFNHYETSAVVPVAGAPALDVPDRFARRESTSPAQPAGVAPFLAGVTQHLLYTTAAQRRALLEGATPEFPAGGDTLAVIIPIRKSEAWWSLPQDEREAHFHRRPGRDGHTALGLPYVPRIFRRLYHCRYLEGSAGFDFVTYFEFHEGDAADFRRLLAILRDPRVNPEWGFVDAEIEIWARKLT
jgi:hypothetical protein